MVMLRSIFLAAFVLGTVGAAVAHEEPAAAEMAQAAQRFIATLSEAQTADAVVAWDSDLRRGWYFVPDRFIQAPAKRSGLPIGRMTSQQRPLAHALVAAVLSHKGIQQVAAIAALESVLRELENNNPIRDPELYYVTIFGHPSTDKTWAWRFEGHHLSINVTLVRGQHVSVTPSFFGSNPGRVPSGSLAGLRILADEEDLARRLVRSLGDEQRRQAILSETAPQDVITGNDRKVDKGVFLPPRGVTYKALNDEQQALLLAVVDTFTRKYRPQILEQINVRAKIADTDTMFFAWAGGLEPGQGHYFRVQTARYLFEYDNTQNNANHVHAVWRDFDGDFGEDLLRKHYDEAHSNK
jgi:hypothetical protein